MKKIIAVFMSFLLFFCANEYVVGYGLTINYSDSDICNYQDSRYGKMLLVSSITIDGSIGVIGYKVKVSGSSSFRIADFYDFKTYHTVKANSCKANITTVIEVNGIGLSNASFSTDKGSVNASGGLITKSFTRNMSYDCKPNTKYTYSFKDITVSALTVYRVSFSTNCFLTFGEGNSRELMTYCSRTIW